MPFAPFQYRAWCKKMDWSTGQLSSDPSVIYDGDTGYFFKDNGERTYSNQPCRFYGIQCEEMNSTDPALKAKAVAARDFVRSEILGKQVWIQSLDLDPHGRPVIVVWQNAADVGDRSKSLNRKLLDLGHAVPYLQTKGAL
jgi:endonuclease YncB( thermonuclease family)